MEAVTAPLTLANKIPGVKGLTKNLFRTPSPPEAPAAPNAETKAVQTATAEAAQRRSRARGFQSTILSQPSELKQTYGS
jgi:hypothetical protein